MGAARTLAAGRTALDPPWGAIKMAVNPPEGEQWGTRIPCVTRTLPLRVPQAINVTPWTFCPIIQLNHSNECNRIELGHR